jgi:agmatine deiminase
MCVDKSSAGRRYVWALCCTIVGFAASVHADENEWRRADRECHGNLQRMLEVIAAAPVIPQWRTNRSADELTATLRAAGRFRQLGLTNSEGAALVRAVYARMGVRLTRPVGDMRQLLPSAPEPATPPLQFRAGTEFEQLDSVLLRWPFDWTNLKDEYAAMIGAFGQGGVTARVWVDSPSQQASATQYLQNQNVSIDHVEWIVENTDSVWLRDYGPQFLYAVDGPQWGVADFHYYDSRPADDDTPLAVADLFDLPVVNRQTRRIVYTEGGNLSHDGVGNVTYSQRTYAKNLAPKSVVDQRILSAFQATQKIVLKDPSLDSTGHVDMFTKVLDETTVLVGQYAPDQVDYQVLEDAAATFNKSTNGAGQPWNVVRIPQPDIYYVGFVIPVVRTYTNSQFANGIVVVPVYGLPGDADALAIYEQHMPNRQIIPLNANDIIESGGAWHCVCMEMPQPGE